MNILMYLVYLLVLFGVVWQFSMSDELSEYRTNRNIVLVFLTALFAFLYSLGGIQWHISEVLEIPFRFNVMERLNMF